MIDNEGQLSGIGLRDWLRERIAHYLDQPVETIDPDVHLAEYGMDSVYAVSVVADLEERLGVRLGNEAAWESPTVTQLAARIDGARGRIDRSS